jgi:4-hydroxybenzoate polyprenyltransferase
VSNKRVSDNASAAFISLGLLLGVVQLAFRPFLLGPAALVALLIGTLFSGRYRRLSLVTALVIATFFVVGAAITVWYSRPLY